MSGQDNLAAYGDTEGDQAHRYGRTREFLQLVRQLWTEEDVTYQGEHFQVAGSTVTPRTVVRGDRRHPRLYFGGASDAAQRVAADRGRRPAVLGRAAGGRRATGSRRCAGSSRSSGASTRRWSSGCGSRRFVRDTTEQAWAEAEEKVAEMANGADTLQRSSNPGFKAVGQQRLLDLAERGDVLDSNLYTAPGRHGGGGAGTTWLVGSAEDVAASLRRYQELGITHFVLSDTPYLREIRRQGDQLLPLLRS